MGVVCRRVCDRLGLKGSPVVFSDLPSTPGREASPIRVPRSRWVHDAPCFSQRSWSGGQTPRCRRLRTRRVLRDQLLSTWATTAPATIRTAGMVSFM